MSAAFELLVVDDGSDDATSANAAGGAGGDDRVKVRRREPSGGPRTKGAVLAWATPQVRGEVIGTIDADTRVEPSFLARVMRAWERDPTADALQVARRFRNEAASWLTRAQGEEQLMDMTSQCGRLATDGTAELRGNGMFVRRSALEAVGGWGERALTEDLELSTRLAAAGHRVALAPEVAVQEEAVETIGALWRQRMRWAEGSLRRLLEHGPGFVLGPQPLGRKLDFIAFAGEFAVPPLFAAAVVASLLTVPLPGAADWTVPASLALAYAVGILALALGGLHAMGERGLALIGRGVRGTLFLMHWLVVVPVRPREDRVRPGDDRIRSDAALPRPRLVTAARADVVVRGRIVAEARPDGIETVEAIGIAGGRVVSAGRWDEVRVDAVSGARVIDAGPSAVIPGLHDFHIHLVGLARARGEVLLDTAADGVEIIDLVTRHAATLPDGAWLLGRGWSEALLATVDLAALGRAIGRRPAFLTSHDAHSAWVSPAVLQMAGITDRSPDPPGGRIERDADGEPDGVLREAAMNLVSGFVPEAQGEGLRAALDATLRDLARHGITGASEAGDYTAEGGIGADAPMGDSYSTLTDLGDLVDGRLRLTLGIPVDAMPAAAERGMRTGAGLPDRRTMRFGWAKEYADGALGSGTAALFAPASCRDGDAGILRVTPEGLDGLFATRAAGRHRARDPRHR